MNETEIETVNITLPGVITHIRIDTSQQTHDVYTTSMQRHGVASTLRRRCKNVMCLMGCINSDMSYDPWKCDINFLFLFHSSKSNEFPIDVHLHEMCYLQTACYWYSSLIFEPQHEKTYPLTCASNFRAVWSGPLLFAWRNFASLAIQNARMRRLIWIFARRMSKGTFSDVAIISSFTMYKRRVIIHY